MKILHISNYFAPHIGGIEKTAEDITDALSEHEQALICFNHEKGTVREKRNGVKIVRVGCFAKISSQSLSLTYGRALKKLFCEFEPDEIVFHFPNPFAAHYLLKCLKIRPWCKLTVWYHLDITKQKILGKFFKGQTKRLLARADRIIATSPNYADSSIYLCANSDRVTVLPSCINEERLAPNEDELAAAEEIRKSYGGDTICFSFGRHVGYKGYEYLIDAAEKLNGNLRVLLGGSGPLTEKLKKYAAEKGNRVEFLGKLSESQLKAYLCACNIFCFPSVGRNEAFGLALAEAMYFGKPAVTFTIPGSGVNYVSVNGETGIEVANRDSAAFAEAVNTLASDDGLRKKYGEAAKDRVERLFTKKKFSEKVRRMFAADEEEMSCV